MVFARRDMEIGGGVFEGCDELRALFKTSDFDTDLADWGFRTYEQLVGFGAEEIVSGAAELLKSLS